MYVYGLPLLFLLRPKCRSCTGPQQVKNWGVVLRENVYAPSQKKLPCAIFSQEFVRVPFFSFVIRGGSLKTLAAQLIVTEYITKIKFMQMCSKGHKLEKEYQGCTASLESRYVGHYPGDVAVLEDGKLKAIVEIKVPRGTAVGDLWVREYLVGAENLWEVDADTVIGAQSRLHYAKGNVDLDANNPAKCQPCM